MKGFLSLLLLFLLLPSSFSQQLSAVWEQKASIPAPGRFWGFAMSIGDKGYAGTGRQGFSGNPTSDFWEYDPTLNVWTQKADYPGGVREGCASFSTGERGFVGFGTAFIQFTRTLYEFLPDSNKWVQQADHPGIGFAFSHGFTIEDTLYIGPENGTNKFYAYNTVAGTWTEKAPFPGGDRRAQVGFAAQGKGYIGMGAGVFSGVFGDFYCYDPKTDSWTQIADISPKSDQSTAISINGEGYVYNVGGNLKQVFTYNVAQDRWDFVSNLPNDRIANASMFAIGDTGYIVLGEETKSGGNVPSNMLWGFLPQVSASDAIEEAIDRSQLLINTDGTALDIHLTRLDGKSYTLNILSIEGKLLHSTAISGQPEWTETWPHDHFPSGLYIVSIHRDGTRVVSQKIILR